MKVLVTGGTGKVGSLVITELLQRGAQVRALVRKPAAGQFPAGVETAVGDLLDPVSVEAALQGVDKLFLLNAVVPDELTQALIAYALAKRAGIKHIVYLSVFAADQYHDVAHFASKATVEIALRNGGVPFTILRPGFFFQNDAQLKAVIAGYGVYPMPLGTKGVAAVDVRDIAAAAAIALTEPGHEGQMYNLAGPVDLTGPANASLWSKLLGKEIRYGGEDLDAWEKQMRPNAPAWMAFDLRMMLQGFIELGMKSTKTDLERVTKLLGRAPRTYESFASETAKAWLG